MYPNSSRSTTPDSAAMLGSTSSGSLRHVQFSMSRHQLVRRPSYEQDEDYGQWDEQGADEPFFYDDRDDMRRTQGRGPSPPPQHAKDHMNRFAPRGAPQPKPQHFVPVATQYTGSGGGSVKAAVRKFQYRAPEAGASASSLMLPKTGSAPIPILKQNTGQNSAYRRAAADSTRTAFSAPTATAGGLNAVMNPAMNDSRDSLLRSNPNLKVVDGELRMAVFPERKRSGDASAAGLQLVHAHRRRGSGSAEREVDITEMGWREKSREREGLRAELARRSQSPEPAPPPPAYARPAVAAMAPPVAAPPSVTKAAPAPFRPAAADEKALVSPKALVARNFVASIVGELKRGRAAKPAAPPPPPPAATKPKASKWAPVDTSAGLKRKWEPGNHVPSTIRSYVHLLSGGPVPHALGRMESAN